MARVIDFLCNKKSERSKIRSDVVGVTGFEAVNNCELSAYTGVMTDV